MILTPCKLGEREGISSDGAFSVAGMSFFIFSEAVFHLFSMPVTTAGWLIQILLKFLAKGVIHVGLLLGVETSVVGIDAVGEDSSRLLSGGNLADRGYNRELQS